MYDFGSYIIYRITRKYRFYWFYFISIFDKKICSERISPEGKTLANAWPDQLKLDKLDDSLLDEEDFYEEDYEDDDDLYDDDDDYYDDEEYYEDEYNDEDGKVTVMCHMGFRESLNTVFWNSGLKKCLGPKSKDSARMFWNQQLEIRVLPESFLTAAQSKLRSYFYSSYRNYLWLRVFWSSGNIACWSIL